MPEGTGTCKPDALETGEGWGRIKELTQGIETMAGQIVAECHRIRFIITETKKYQEKLISNRAELLASEEGGTDGNK